MPETSNVDVEQVICDVLVELGVPTHIKGYRYISTALRMSVEKPDIMDAITNELYPSVAEVYETTWRRVERAIRHAVELAWDRCDLDVRYKYFGNTISNLRCKPTNSEFLTMTAIIVKRRMKNRG